MTLHYHNPRTIVNYVSGLTSVLKRLSVDVASFDSVDVTDFLSSIKINVRHTPNKRLAVHHDMLQRIIAVTRTDVEGPTVVFAFILMFMTFLRQSNCAPRNKSGFDPTRHLTRQDIVTRHDGLVVAIKWSKSQQGPTATSVAAPAKPGHPLCPVAAYYGMLAHAPTTRHLQPLFTFRDGSCMPTSYMNRVWDRVMATIGCPKRAFTLHSLRRGAASQVYAAGAASIHQLQMHGQWASSAVMEYLPNDPTRSEVYAYFKDL